MRSFATLSLLASVAFFGFSAAAPPSDYSGARSPAARGVDQVANVVGTGPIGINIAGHKVATPPRDEVEQEAGVVKTDPINVEVLNNGFATRDDEPRSLPVIILGVSGRIAPLCKKLGTLASVDVNVKVITPIVDEIKDILAEATAEVQLLKDHPIEYILYLNGRILSIKEIGDIVGSLIILIYTAIAGVLAVVEAAQFKLVVALLIQLSIVLAGLLKVVFAIVVDLQAVVVVVIEDVIPTILDIDCTDLIVILGIHY